MLLTIRKVDFSFFEENLAKYYLVDFPEEERCPLNRLNILYVEGKIELLALFNGEVLCGYAILLLNANNDNCIIWYIAIFEEYRNRGFGTDFLKLLKVEFTCLKNVFLEVERRNCGANEYENAMREKRFKFYKKLGFYLSELKVCVYGVEYEIFLFDECKESVDTLFEIYKDIYYNSRSKDVIDRNIVKIL